MNETMDNRTNAERLYADIIDLPHPEPRTRPRMSMENRAAQFAPFAALTGYDDVIRETARETAEETEIIYTDQPFIE